MGKSGVHIISGESMEMLITVSQFILEYLYIFACYYIVMGIITFIIFAADKSKAKAGVWRISEATLLGLSFIGGSGGAFLAMRILRHKTKHIKFRILVPLSLILHASFAAVVVYLGLFA
jgi:uncharacterized membrane protein YsdA (DUF1294 family)